MKNKNKKIIDEINQLEGYEGYVQFSHRPIDLAKDVFLDKSPKVQEEEGFIYEAHFCNKKESVSIRQFNDTWKISRTNIEHCPTQLYMGIDTLKVKMAQVWEKEADALCEGMDVMKLKKVVFAGFEKGEAS